MGFGVWGLGFRFGGLGFRFGGLGWGFRFRALGFRIPTTPGTGTQEGVDRHRCSACEGRRGESSHGCAHRGRHHLRDLRRLPAEPDGEPGGVGSLKKGTLLRRSISPRVPVILTPKVEAGLKMIKQESCDFVLSFGGGSPHDCAKAIAITCTNGGDIRAMEGVDKSTQPMLTLVAVNTTAGTGAEMTRFCIITDEDSLVLSREWGNGSL